MASTSSSQTQAANPNTNDFFFGWDLLYRTVESSIKKKPDVLIALAHFILVKNSQFRCIGLGDDKNFNPDDVGSEIIPDGWNDNQQKYALRYLNNNKLYLLLGHVTEDCIIINFLDVQTNKVTNVALDFENIVKCTTGPISRTIPTAHELVERYRTELVQPVFSGNRREVTTQTTSTQSQMERNDPLRIGDPMRVIDPLRIGDPMRPGQFVPSGLEPRPFGFPDVGRSDLDPLGHLGPGNLMSFPPRPNFNEAQPRFDPFAPPDRNIRPNPNPDHMQPPDFGGHDYYM